VGLRAESNKEPLAVTRGAETFRIRILHTSVPTHLSSTGSFQYQLRKGGKRYSIKNSVRVRALGRAMIFGQKSFKGEVIVVPSGSSDTLKINGRRYRGALVFHPLGRGRYDIVEYVDLESYLYGVLPKEVDPKWPMEALKAQAVVSRTYALANKSQAPEERYDLMDSVYDQVFGGLEVESPSSNQAVDATRGEILVDGAGKPLQSYFHSSCGGRTERPEHVWKSPAQNEAFGSVEDLFCQEDPHYRWTLELSYATIRRRCQRAGIRIREIRKIEVVRKSPSGRAEMIALKTARGTVEVPGNRFRLAIGADLLRSTLLVELKAGKKSAVFVGKGWGHGVGLCQWGTRGRAMAGQSHQEILKAYYPGSKLLTPT
jgi:stage II sporulation protein D